MCLAPILADSSVLPGFTDPILLVLALAWGVYGALKRQSTQAHEIIVATVSDAKTREKSDADQIKQMMAQMASMQADQIATNRWREESTRLQSDQSRQIGSLEKSVAMLEQALAEERQINAQLRERLTACEAERLTERNGREVAERENSALRQALKTSDDRLAEILKAIAEEQAASGADDAAVEAVKEFGSPPESPSDVTVQPSN